MFALNSIIATRVTLFQQIVTLFFVYSRLKSYFQTVFVLLYIHRLFKFWSITRGNSIFCYAHTRLTNQVVKVKNNSIQTSRNFYWYSFMFHVDMMSIQKLLSPYMTTDWRWRHIFITTALQIQSKKRSWRVIILEVKRKKT